MRKSLLVASILVVGFLFVGTSKALAHDQIPGAPQNRAVVIKGVTIHRVDGPIIENGSVLFEQGKITAVGKAVVVPEKAIEIDGSDKHVYPGLIEPMTDLGLREINAVSETSDTTEHGDRNPNAKSWVAVNPDSELIPVARAGGVLTVMTAPMGRWLRGQSAVINLDGWSVDEMALLAPAGLYVDWDRMEPSEDDEKKRIEKRTERIAELDALLDEAKRYGEGRQANANDTPTDLRLESLLKLIRGEFPLIAEANKQSVIESAVAFAQRHQLKLTLYGGYDAVSCAELLKKYDVPVIVGGVHRLPMRRHDPFDAAYTLPARLHAAGVRYCVGGAGAGSPGGAAAARNLPYHAGNAVAYGLPREEAIRSITLSAAEILGVADRIGSITVSKDATLILTDGDILETPTHVVQAWIGGREVDLGSRHKTLYDKYRKKYSR
ncbi:MAG: amidohydrolase family protein [Pirellulaceae bacterium]